MNGYSGLKYRDDIDGLRAIAVLAVIVFHFGLVPNGYLGVDVFFVISGFLITGILYRGLENDTLSITHFYLRRIRRIIPLVLFITAVALCTGIIVMLPYDLDALCQSVVATNAFSNNFLEFVTTKDYWNIVNEFKPLMHTWSLGIEEQYYVLYPFLFMAIRKKWKGLILPVLIICSIVSLLLFFSDFPQHYKFYLLPFRFFELALGGCAAILFKDRLWSHRISFLFIAALIILLVMDGVIFTPAVHLLLIISVTLLLLVSSLKMDRIATVLLQNRWLVWTGKISFSLYMWHHLLLAFTRYFIVEEIHNGHLVIIFGVTFFLSAFSYHFIEQPFRNRDKVKTKSLLWILGISFLIINGSALYIYFKGGVIRDVPELEINTSNVYRNMHLDYNTRHIGLYNAFDDTTKTNILVVGNSYARDWINVLLESKYIDYMTITYYTEIINTPQFNLQLNEADRLFFTQMEKKPIDDLIEERQLDRGKVFFLGPKKFGANNGIYYNASKDENYCKRRTSAISGTVSLNNLRKQEWGVQFIDLLGFVIDDQKSVPVFTPDCKFISQDCLHFTRAGASYYAGLLDVHLDFNLLKVK